MKPKIVIEFNNLSSNRDRCAICEGKRQAGKIDPNFGDVGPHFMIAKTKELVCQFCTKKYAPAMYTAMQAFNKFLIMQAPPSPLTPITDFEEDLI